MINLSAAPEQSSTFHVKKKATDWIYGYKFVFVFQDIYMFNLMCVVAFAVEEMRVKLFRGSTDVNKPRRTLWNLFTN
jgi:hypothetical protein